MATGSVKTQPCAAFGLKRWRPSIHVLRPRPPAGHRQAFTAVHKLQAATPQKASLRAPATQNSGVGVDEPAAAAGGPDGAQALVYDGVIFDMVRFRGRICHNVLR